MSKTAKPDYAIHEVLRKRWSPYAFADRPIAAADLFSLFEAARWAASSYNEQPWSFLIARRHDEPDEFQRAVSCLVEPNQEWARHAPVLVLTATRLQFQRNGKPNAAAIHDLGLSVANLTFEATARGIYVHQMIGIVPAQVRAVYELPEGVQPVTAFAVGYPGSSDEIPEKFRERDAAPRQREPVSSFLFQGKWGESWSP